MNRKPDFVRDQAFYFITGSSNVVERLLSFFADVVMILSPVMVVLMLVENYSNGTIAITGSEIDTIVLKEWLVQRD
ncbi:hypothetical protein C4G43_RS19755 [Vibrio parahaemolyticus]|nr:hypothetical protein [Vibrio parahaemolyticus]